MKYCNNCQEFIPSTEHCPNCGTDDIENAGGCVICGRPIRSHEDYCKDCLRLAELYIYELTEALGITKEKAKDLILAEIEKEK